jgi:predicted acylesterase/phospholipase RssA
MRSLILAGGGLKVAYQAGCLQVLLDECGLTFDHVDAASGGCFNAAMMASGKSGTEIADLWRTMNPGDFTTINFRELLKGPWFRSIGTTAGLDHIFTDVWNLDWNRIRTKQKTTYTFNHFDFTQKRVVVTENTALDQDLLGASVAITMWFSPVFRPNDGFLFDAVYSTDGNVGGAVRRGADEIWVIWTVADNAEYRSGFVSEYFHLIETVADAKFRDEWGEIAAVNAAIDANGGPVNSRGATDLRLREGYASAGPLLAPPPGRIAVKQHLIRQDVPMHYVLIFGRDRVAAAVEMGVQDTRKYVRDVLKKPLHIHLAPALNPPVGFSFIETMTGYFMPGECNPNVAERLGKAARNRLKVRLKIETHDLARLVTDPAHACSAEGAIDAPLLSAQPISTSDGTFNLFINDRKPETLYPQHPNAPKVVVAGHKRMVYKLPFVAGGISYLFIGQKFITDENGFSVWHDTTTLYCKIFIVNGTTKTFYASGIIHVSLPDFLAEFPSIRTSGSKWFGIPAKARFGQFFIGQCWDVYMRQIIEYAPF